MHDGAALAQVFTLGACDCCTGFCLTRRWREMDSNFWYRGTKTVDFAAFLALRGIGGLLKGACCAIGTI